MTENPDGRQTLTSLQRPLGDFVAKRAQTRPVVSGHLDLIVGPDDELLQKQVSHVWTGDVLELVVHRQPGQTVPNKPQISQGIFHTSAGLQRGCSASDILLEGDKAPAKPLRRLLQENTCCFIWM